MDEKKKKKKHEEENGYVKTSDLLFIVFYLIIIIIIQFYKVNFHYLEYTSLSIGVRCMSVCEYVSMN